MSDEGPAAPRLPGRASPATADAFSRGLERFNVLDAAGARSVLLRCCGSASWADQMAERRPFRTVGELCEAADEIWSSLTEEDWLEAFSHHPRIGGTDVEQDRYADTRELSRSEQAGVAAAPSEVRAALAAGNEAYFERFGYIFLICATGKSAEEMLEQLESRLGNDPAIELSMAAEQQQLITQLRLKKLLPELV